MLHFSLIEIRPFPDESSRSHASYLVVLLLFVFVCVGNMCLTRLIVIMFLIGVRCCLNGTFHPLRNWMWTGGDPPIDLISYRIAHQIYPDPDPVGIITHMA